MDKPSADYILGHCLYFSASRMARHMDKIAEEAFQNIDLPPSYSYILIAISDKPGITQKELCKTLCISPSTSSRFIDKLRNQGLVERKTDGKHTQIYTTANGEQMVLDIYRGLNQIYMRHLELLGEEHGKQLIELLNLASRKIERVE
ncbi:MarR family winged helix-turn-helix transcriptional regulator [Paenibacillus sp. J2TS4]|uniref:MarR family winged helix-turn-helix transcriptional regulator n=1 Tax=Paenibacillus sp. J2TS4 TaxID=2807194 RepID=UPI001B1B7E7A|nr:MarR family transcriptional regulator [Paenibacillus sp. J2TS4]GIP36078.1 hypothetical protein J2TS4_52880 [Paenibacillus sp. J2TS4]